jgi:tripartite-type tricarboxylate transporter receptor subunit TctC
MIGRRTLLLSAASLAASPAIARAQAKFPAEAVKIVVPRAPGGGTDILVRLIQPGLEKKFGVPVVVDNRPDAAAVVGAIVVAKAKPDGLTLLASDNAFYQNPAILDSLPYDTFKDFTAVTMMAKGPVILLAYPGLGVTTLPQLIELARRQPLTFASGGIGASTHLMGVMFNLRAGTSITHVPFKGTGPALIALLGGHVSMQFGGISSALPYVKDGKVRAIAVTGTHRDPNLPDVPTFTEAGLKDADVESIWGLHAPAGTPANLRRVLRDAVVEVLNAPDLAPKLVERGYEVIGNTPDEHQKQTEALVAQWIEVGKKVNLRE